MEYFRVVSWISFGSVETFLDSLNDRRNRLLQVTFTRGDDFPSETAKFISLAIVAFDIALEFFVPEFAVGFWQGIGALWTSVPVAAVDEDRELFRNKRNIRPAGSFFVMQTISPEAFRPKSAS